MTRPRRRMLAAVAVVLLGVGLARASLAAALAVVIIGSSLSAVPGREFFRGRAALAANEPARAIARFERFMADEGSWRLRALRWLWLGIYTSDPVALTLNNVSACRLGLGDVEGAIAAARRALERDDGYALPHVQLAIAHRLAGAEGLADEHAAMAVRLGYRPRGLDAAIRRAAAEHNEAVGRAIR